MQELSSQEIRRYNRHIRLPEIGIEGQKKLRQASVLLIGVGALGSPVLQYLNSTGVGRIGIVDHSIVQDSHLHGQQIFSFHDVGKHKSIVAKQKLLAQNPNLQCDIYNIKLKPDFAEHVISKYDIVIDSTDSPKAKYLINDTCIQLGKPMIYGFALQFQGETTVFNYQDGPSYRCLHPEPSPNESDKDKKGVIATLPGIIGTFQANEAIKIITGAGHVLSGKLYRFNALDFSSEMIPIERNPDNFKW